jgi:hypothetical protein
MNLNWRALRNRESKRKSLGEPAEVIRKHRSGIVLSVDAMAVIIEARRTGVVIEFAPQSATLLLDRRELNYIAALRNSAIILTRPI